MDKKKTKKLLAMMAVAYWIMVILVYLVAHPQFRYTGVESDALSPSTLLGEIVDGMQVQQTLTVPAQTVNALSVMTATYGRENVGTMTFTLTDAAGETVARQEASVSGFADGKYTPVLLDTPVTGRKGEKLTLTIETVGSVPGSAATIYAGNTVTTGRFDIAQNITEADRYRINGQAGVGKLCVKMHGVDELGFYRMYWVLVTAAFAALAACCRVWWTQAKQGRNNPLVAVSTLYTRYSFLIKQLVSRDFKIKYKRSALGMAWSFLNPLLTMAVQYIVFSTLFKSDIPNYPLYLFTGIVFFNFFTEAVNMGMTAITGNASLIKKVYIPKYIFPVSRIISSLVNFALALIPLLLVMIVTGTALRPSLLLLVFDILCLLGFVIGMGLILAICMTFFQDTQFLWGVVSMMWMYLTPVFYPETIIPAKLLTLYHMNPLYQYITFARICIIDGVSPAPTAYLWCLLSSVVVLLVGIVTFKRHQDKFVLYL